MFLQSERTALQNPVYKHHLYVLGGIWVVALLLLSTLLKTQLVADYFMALKYSRPLWRIIITVYLVIIVSMIGLAYWLGASDIS